MFALNKRWNIDKKITISACIGLMVSLTAFGTVFASTPDGPGKPAEVQEEIKPQSSGYWVKRDGSWYFYHADGRAGSGWVEDQGKHYYLANDGRMLTNCMTPDGYFVDAGGEWYQRKTTIMDETFTAPSRFPAPYSSWVNGDQLASLRSKIRSVFKERRLKISDNAIEYVVTSNNKERVLMGVYQLNETGSFRLDLGISLDASSMEPDEPETYDYMVFRAMMYEITSAPDHLEKAIYSSWEESNTWNIDRDHSVWIGDSWVRYGAASGYGQYLIEPKYP